MTTKYSDYAFVIQGTFSSVATACFFLLLHCSSTTHFYVIAGIYGLTTSPLVVLKTTALVNMVGMNGLSTAYGITETVFGSSNMIGATLIAGMAHDYFGNYRIPFYLAGTCFGTGSVLKASSHPKFILHRNVEKFAYFAISSTLLLLV